MLAQMDHYNKLPAYDGDLGRGNGTRADTQYTRLPPLNEVGKAASQFMVAMAHDSYRQYPSITRQTPRIVAMASRFVAFMSVPIAPLNFPKPSHSRRLLC